jgi:hypothetical protein
MREMPTEPSASSRVARGQRLHPLIVAARVQFRRIDAAQTDTRGDVHAGPDAHPRLERVAVEHAHHFGRMTAA